MADSEVRHKLAAILHADVAGYSRLMADDPENALTQLTACRQLFADLAEQNGGRIVNAPGDSILVELGSVIDAVSCAVEVQQALARRNAELPEPHRMAYRIGVNLGDVLELEGALYGEGVNFAARLQSLSRVGGVCVSASVYEQVRSRLPLQFEAMDERSVKHRVDPVQCFHVVLDTAAAPVEAEGSAGEPGASGAGRAGAARAPDHPSVAVLAFDNLTRDPEQEAFCDGISEDLITDLSKVSGLKVAARNSSFQYKGRPVDLRTVGRALGVRYILEGSVRRQGQRLRITAQLIDVDTGRHVWADRFDRDAADLFAVQDEIGRNVVENLRVKLVEGEQMRIWSRFLSSEAARELYYRAARVWHRPTRETALSSRELFQQVVTLEPDAPNGHSGLGWTHLLEVMYGWSADPAASLRAADEACERAMACSDVYPAAHSLRSHLHLWAGRHEQALQAGERGEALAFDHAYTVAYLASVLDLLGRPEEALARIGRALRLSPYPPAWFMAVQASAYRGCGRLEEAIASCRAALQLDAQVPGAHATLIAALVEAGQQEAARREVKALLKEQPRVTASGLLGRPPFRQPEVRERTLASLRAAGLAD